jgi:hypothetical protein
LLRKALQAGVAMRAGSTLDVRCSMFETGSADMAATAALIFQLR